MNRYDGGYERGGEGRAPGRALDPNYRGGWYRGERMRGEAPGPSAAYGAYRLRHADDLGGHGGFYGLYGARQERVRWLGGPSGAAPGDSLGMYQWRQDWARRGPPDPRAPRYDRELRYDGSFRPPAR